MCAITGRGGRAVQGTCGLLFNHEPFLTDPGSNHTQGIFIGYRIIYYEWTRYILPTEYDIDHLEFEITCGYSNSRAPGDLWLLTTYLKLRGLKPRGLHIG